MATGQSVEMVSVDSDGHPYNEQRLTLSVAKEVLRRAGVSAVRVDGVEVPLSRLTLRAIRESRRGAQATGGDLMPDWAIYLYPA